MSNSSPDSVKGIDPFDDPQAALLHQLKSIKDRCENAIHAAPNTNLSRTARAIMHDANVATNMVRAMPILKARDQPKLKAVSELPNGCRLYVRDNEVGGRTYYSDEVGGGVFVWDTCLVTDSTLLAALTHEAKLYYCERTNQH